MLQEFLYRKILKVKPRHFLQTLGQEKLSLVVGKLCPAKQRSVARLSPAENIPG